MEGTPLTYRTWGDAADRSIVLVHGGGAHSRWWDHIAPLLARGWQVLALDLSGHGDSGRRPRYSLDTWASEVLAVVAEAGDAASSVVIGHSVGGLVTLRLASLAGSQIAGAVAIDSPVRDMAPEDRGPTLHNGPGSSADVGRQWMGLLIGRKGILEDRLQCDERHRCLRTRGRRRSLGCFIQYHANHPRAARLVQQLIER